MKQRFIISHANTFQNELNAWLFENWRVVSNTIGGHSFRRVAESYERKNERGESFDHLMWCVIEKGEKC